MKERKKITEITITESAEICSVKTNTDGRLSLINSDGNSIKYTQSESVGYIRDSGKIKILRSIVRKEDDQTGHNPWKKYDKIGFIDTNNINKNGRKLFVSSPSLLIWKDVNRRFADICHIDPFVGYCISKLNPERIGWADFIQRMQASMLLESSDKILIIVDSDKESISSINERQEPVFMDFMLPNGFTIAYATSDSGAENWINKEMKRRDKVAGRALLKVKKNQNFLKLLATNDKVYIKNDFE